MTELIACICEGGSELAIMDLLIDSNKLKFNRESLIDHELLSTRGAEKFALEYLTRDYDGDLIRIIRILDSPKENFKIRKPYNQKVIAIDSYFTRPEIEILVIIAENHYETYTNNFKHIKAHDYCINNLKIPRVKNYKFIKDYFANIDMLIEVLRKYSHYSRISGYNTIFDLLK
jgi:hypothetical protein